MHKNLLRALLMLIVSFSLLVPQHAGAQPSASSMYAIAIKIVKASDKALLAKEGVTPLAIPTGRFIARVSEDQLRALQQGGIAVTVINLNGTVTPRSLQAAQSTADAQLSNSDLTLSLLDTGQFSLQASDGRYLLYPDAHTTYLSVKVDSTVYNNKDGSLPVLTPLSSDDSSSAYITYETPEQVVVTETYTLVGSAVEFTTQTQNLDTVPHNVSVRYLLDTQVDTNDGSPLFAPPVGVRTSETDLPGPAFTTWQGYDQWPNPTLTAAGTLSTLPSRMVFAYWPNAYQYPFDYSPDPQQPFYTPGYTQSPRSDSCVLLYFDQGSLGPGDKNQVVTYYGTGAPAANADRANLIATFAQLRDAVKASMRADLDAFSDTQASYYVTMRTDWKDYLETAWSLATLVYDPADLGTLAKDLEPIRQAAGVVDAVGNGTTVAQALIQTGATIPQEAQEADVRDQYIYPAFHDHYNLGGSTPGVAGVLNDVDVAYQNTVDSIPDPLPANYPVQRTIAFMNRQIAALYSSAQKETWVPIYASNTLSLAKLGVLQVQRKTMRNLASIGDLAGDVSFITTVAQIGTVGLAGAIKVAGLVGEPVTLGGSTLIEIPAEAAFWGGVGDIALISSLAGSAAGAAGLTVKGQMSIESLHAMAQLLTDLKLRRTLFQGTGDLLSHPVSQNARSLQARGALAQSETAATVTGIVIPDVTIGSNDVAGQGIGQITLSNAGASPVAVNVYGNITADAGSGTSIVGLAGSSQESINPGANATIALPYTVLRSSLVGGTGYDLHIFVALADGDGNIDVQGPFVAHFFAGTSQQLAVLTQQAFTTVAHDSVEVGQAYSTTVQLSPTTERTRFLLSFPEGSDMDLHLYDAAGNHVGVNYSTGQVDDQIPGATFSGPTVWPQWIELQNPQTTPYTVQVVAQNTAAGAQFDLSQLDSPSLAAILDTPASTAWEIVRTQNGQTVTESYSLLASESGGSRSITNVQARASDFVNASGQAIPSSQIAVLAPQTIGAGQREQIGIHITAGPTVPDGVYVGNIQLTGQDPGGSLLTSTTQVSLSVTSSNTVPASTMTPSPINTPVPPTTTPTNTAVPPVAAAPNTPVPPAAPTSMPNPPVVAPSNTAVSPSAPPPTAPAPAVPTSTVSQGATIAPPTATSTPIARVAGVTRKQLACARPAVTGVLVNGKALKKGTQLVSGQMLAVRVHAVPRTHVQTLIDLTHTVTTTTGTGRHRKTVKRIVVVGHVAATATTNRTGDATGYARVAYVPTTAATVALKVGVNAACGGNTTMTSPPTRLNPAYVAPLVSVSLPNGKPVAGATIKTNSAILVRVDAAEDTPVKIAVTLHVQGSKEGITYTTPSNARLAAPRTGKLDGRLSAQMRIPYEPRQYKVAATLTVNVSARSAVHRDLRTLTATTGALHVTLQSERPPQRARRH